VRFSPSTQRSIGLEQKKNMAQLISRQLRGGCPKFWPNQKFSKIFKANFRNFSKKMNFREMAQNRSGMQENLSRTHN